MFFIYTKDTLELAYSDENMTEATQEIMETIRGIRGNKEYGYIVKDFPNGHNDTYDIIDTGNGVDIVAIRSITPVTPQPPTETELLGQQLVDLELQNLDIQSENQSLGQQMVDIDLRLLNGGL